MKRLLLAFLLLASTSLYGIEVLGPFITSANITNNLPDSVVTNNYYGSIVTINNALKIAGSTPSITIGDAGAEDTSVVFLGNAKDFHIGLDDTTDDLTFGLGKEVGTTSYMVIENAGNVGIGINNPGDFDNGADNLVVGTGTGSEGLTIYASSANDSNIHFSDGTVGSAVYVGTFAYNHLRDDAVIKTNATTAMVLTSANAVGFGGETAPVTLMELTNSEPYITLHNYTEEDTEGGSESSLIGRGEKSGGEEYVAGKLHFSKDGNGNDEKSDLILFTNNGSDGTSPTERLRIDSSGHVGIGTTTPAYSLDVEGTANIKGDLRVNDKSLFVDSVNHLVGIGTSTPATKIHTVGSTAQIGTFTRTSSANTAAVYFDYNLYDSADNETTYARFMGRIEDNTNGAEDGSFIVRTITGGGALADDFVVSSGKTGVGYDAGTMLAATAKFAVNGDVGIGTTAPAYDLSVVGTTNTTVAYLLNGASLDTGGTLANVAYLDQENTFTATQNIDGDLFVNDTLAVINGNVGIGTTAPVASLEINNPGEDDIIAMGNSSDVTTNYFNSGGDSYFINNLAIGTDNATYDLTVLGTANATIFYDGTSSIEGGVGTGFSSITSTELTSTTINATGSGGLYFVDDGDNLGIFVEDGGNVGIATQNPSVALEVSGDFKYSDMTYGEMYVSYNTTATNVSGTSNYAIVTVNVIAGELNNCTYADGKLTIQKDGVYVVNCNISFTGGVNDSYHGGISINDVDPGGDVEFQEDGDNPDRYTSTSCGGILTLSATDTVGFAMENDTSYANPIIKFMNFRIHRISP